MTRTKACVKKRQQRRRLEREAERAEQAQVEEAVAVPQDNDTEPAGREKDEADKSLKENPEEEEEEAQEKFSAQQEGNVCGIEDEEQEGEGEGKGGGGGEEEEEEEEEEEGNGGGEEGHLVLTDYEKQRERRLKENAAKLAALNLPSLASSFKPPVRPRRQCSKRKSKKDDDYVPSSSSDSEASDSDDNIEESCDQQDADRDYDEDQALQEAIALSLSATTENGIGARSKVLPTRKGKRQVADKRGVTKKRRKGRQEQVTADEIAAIFSVFDEQGKGKFSVAELERIAHSHDFLWSKQEISDMIDFFDINKDGQLDLSEFQGIFERMNMLKMHAT